MTGVGDGVVTWLEKATGGRPPGCLGRIVKAAVRSIGRPELRPVEMKVQISVCGALATDKLVQELLGRTAFQRSGTCFRSDPLPRDESSEKDSRSKLPGIFRSEQIRTHITPMCILHSNLLGPEKP